jgi:hypothetical protein
LGSHTLKWLVGVVFIATNKIVAVGEVCWQWAHRTVRCATGQCLVCRHVIPPLGLGAGRPLEALSSCGTGQFGATPDSLVPLCPSALTSDLHCSLCRVDHCAQIVIAPGKPEGEEFEVDLPWCTGHCPVAHRTVRCARPGSTSVSFAPFLLALSFDFILV